MSDLAVFSGPNWQIFPTTYPGYSQSRLQKWGSWFRAKLQNFGGAGKIGVPVGPPVPYSQKMSWVHARSAIAGWVRLDQVGHGWVRPGILRMHATHATHATHMSGGDPPPTLGKVTPPRLPSGAAPGPRGHRTCPRHARIASPEQFTKLLPNTNTSFRSVSFWAFWCFVHLGGCCLGKGGIGTELIPGAWDVYPTHRNSSWIHTRLAIAGWVGLDQ
eukprot:gene7352-biopygen4546